MLGKRKVAGYEGKGGMATSKGKEHFASMSALRLEGQQTTVWTFLLLDHCSGRRGEERSSMDLMSPLGPFFVALNSAESPF